MKLTAATILLLLLLLPGAQASGQGAQASGGLTRPVPLQALLPSLPAPEPPSEVGKQQAPLPSEPSPQPLPGSRRQEGRRRRHSSHFPLCSYCCNCCRNRGCGLCCRT